MLSAWFTPVPPLVELHMSPIVISFCGGDQRYYTAGQRLREDCVALGLEHDVVELARTEQSWLELCRRKSAFFLEMQQKHRRPIFRVSWVPCIR